jgi:hypothetical protein
LSTITDQPDRHKRNKTCGGGANRDETFTAGFAADFATGFGDAFLVLREADLRAGELRRVARRDVRVAVMSLLSISPPRRVHFYCDFYCRIATKPLSARSRRRAKNYGLRR